jgi:hypothetical protein
VVVPELELGVTVVVWSAKFELDGGLFESNREGSCSDSGLIKAEMEVEVEDADYKTSERRSKRAEFEGRSRLVRQPGSKWFYI